MEEGCFSDVVDMWQQREGEVKDDAKVTGLVEGVTGEPSTLSAKF